MARQTHVLIKIDSNVCNHIDGESAQPNQSAVDKLSSLGVFVALLPGLLTQFYLVTIH